MHYAALREGDGANTRDEIPRNRRAELYIYDIFPSHYDFGDKKKKINKYTIKINKDSYSTYFRLFIVHIVTYYSDVDAYTYVVFIDRCQSSSISAIYKIIDRIFD